VSFVIERVWLFVGKEPRQDEGIVAEQRAGMWFPFVAADERRLESLKERARSLPIAPGTTIKLVRFDLRTELELLRGGH
jgi:hypothetical protein